MVLSHVRFAAGVCVLAAGLLMGAGGAVAVADPGSSDSAAHGDQQSTDAKKPKDEKQPKDKPGGTDTKDGSLGSGGQPGQQHSTDAKKPKDAKPKDEPGGTDTTDGTKDDSDLGAAVPDPVAATPNQVAPVSVAGAPVSDPVAAVPNAVAPVSVAVAPVADPVAAVPNAVAPVSVAVAPVADAGAPVPNVVGPVSNVSALVQDMLTSVAGAVVPLTQLQSDLYSFLLGIAGVAPISDVSALVQDMLTSVVEAVVLLAQLPSDLFSFLLGIAGVQPVVGGVAGIHGPGLSAAAGASVASRLPLGLPLAGISGPPLAGVSGLPVTGEATGVAPLDVIALGRASAVSGMAPHARCRKSDRCGVVFPACFRRHPATRFTVGAGRWRFAGRRRACDHFPGRGARRIPPGQSRCRIAHNGHRVLRPSGGRSVRCRSFGVIGCHPPEGIARRPAGGVKRRTSCR